MSEREVPLPNAPSESKRYWLLLEITDMVARHQNLSDAFKEFAPPLLALTGGEWLDLSLHDSDRDRMLTRYWKKNRENGKFDALPVDETRSEERRVGKEC